MVPLGLWGDGVPCNWDRTESVEVVSLNLPGQGGQYKNLRLPVTALSRKLVTDGTWDDIMAVVAWSLQYAAIGKFPTERHNGSPWLPSDVKRANKDNIFVEELLDRGEGRLEVFWRDILLSQMEHQGWYVLEMHLHTRGGPHRQNEIFLGFSLQTC